jgi:hypothetical protein
MEHTNNSMKMLLKLNIGPSLFYILFMDGFSHRAFFKKEKKFQAETKTLKSKKKLTLGE